MKVFVTIILFDRDYNLIDVAYQGSTSIRRVDESELYRQGNQDMLIFT